MMVVAIILLVIVGLLAFFNMGVVPLDLYFTSLELPFWIIIAGLVLIGMVIGGLFVASMGARNRQLLKEKKEELKNTEASKDQEVERVKKESESQLEIQKKEAEIQRLNERLTSLENKQSNQGPSSPQANSSTSNNSQNNQTPERDIHIEERVVDPSKIQKPKR